MSFSNVGLRWSSSSFPAYLSTVKRPSWANSVCIHHTAAPSLAQRPSGLTAQHIENIRDFYKQKYGWNRGPHLFTDDDDIFGMTPLTVAGIHAVSFNSRSIGIEALGNYDSEDPKSGRGLEVMRTTASAARALFDWMGVEPSEKTLLFHRFDPRTTKTCPGKKVNHDWFLQMVRDAAPGAQSEPDAAGGEENPSEQTVHLVDYVSAQAGMLRSKVVEMLRRDKDGLFYIGEHWVEGAEYNLDVQATVAPKSEADEVVDALTLRQSGSNESDVVPVVATMAALLGISYNVAAGRLKHSGGSFRWDGRAIHGAEYDRTTQSTVAPLSSIRTVLK